MLNLFFIGMVIFQVFDDVVVSGAADKSVLVHNVRVRHFVHVEKKNNNKTTVHLYYSVSGH